VTSSRELALHISGVTLPYTYGHVYGRLILEIKHGRGCVYAIEYYIVWCVKYRHKVLKDEVAEFLKEVLTETAILYGFRVESLEVVEDHVDVLYQLHLSTLYRI